MAIFRKPFLKNIVGRTREMPEGLWTKCPSCGEVIHNLALAENLARWASESQRQHDARIEFAARYRAPLVKVPWQADAPNDLESLLELLDQTEGLPTLW